MNRSLILSVLLLISGCGKTTATHEMTLDGINMSFTYEGYVVDMGEANWIYMLYGKSDGHKVAVEAKLLEAGDIFGCPTQMNVEVNKGLVRYTLIEGAEAIYSRLQSERCVAHYTHLFAERALEQAKNMESY